MSYVCTPVVDRERIHNQEYQTYLTERNVDEEAVRMSASMLVLCAFLTIAVLVWLAIQYKSDIVTALGPGQNCHYKQ